MNEYIGVLAKSMCKAPQATCQESNGHGGGICGAILHLQTSKDVNNIKRHFKAKHPRTYNELLGLEWTADRERSAQRASACKGCKHGYGLFTGDRRNFRGHTLDEGCAFECVADGGNQAFRCGTCGKSKRLKCHPCGRSCGIRVQPRDPAASMWAHPDGERVPWFNPRWPYLFVGKPCTAADPVIPPGSEPAGTSDAPHDNEPRLTATDAGAIAELTDHAVRPLPMAAIMHRIDADSIVSPSLPRAHAVPLTTVLATVTSAATDDQAPVFDVRQLPRGFSGGWRSRGKRRLLPA